MKKNPQVGWRSEGQKNNFPTAQIALWSLGQMGFVLKENRNHACVVVDPYLTDSIETANPGTEFVRAFPPPFVPEDLTGVDAILITHEHDDHLDPATIRRALAADPKIKIVVPRALVDTVRDIVPQSEILGAQEGSPFELGHVRVLPVAAAHPAPELDDFGKSKRLGYLIEMNGVKVFHSGDTLVFDELRQALERQRPDILILPINGGDYFRTRRGIVGNMSHREAVELAAVVKADLLVPAHFDLFPNNRERPSFFVDYLLDHHPDMKFHMFNPGERFLYAKSEEDKDE